MQTRRAALRACAPARRARAPRLPAVARPATMKQSAGRLRTATCARHPFPTAKDAHVPPLRAPQARSLRVRAAAADAPSKTCVTPLRAFAAPSPTDAPLVRSAPPTLEFQRERAKELTKFFKQQAFNAKINDSTCVAAPLIAS